MKKIMLTTAMALTLGLAGAAHLKSGAGVEAAGGVSAITTDTAVHAADPAPAAFGDACKNVKFKVTNKHSKNGDIEVRAVKYFNRANGQWQTEDLPNVVVGQDRTLTTGGDDLRDAEGEALTKFKFVYRWKAAGREANWSGEVNSKEFVPDDPTCNANRTYGNSSWVIGG